MILARVCKLNNDTAENNVDDKTDHNYSTVVAPLHNAVKVTPYALCAAEGGALSHSKFANEQRLKPPCAATNRSREKALVVDVGSAMAFAEF